jgi:hypothetical protein
VKKIYFLIGYLDQMYVYIHLYTHYCTAAKVLRSVPLRNAHSACLLGHNVGFMKPTGNDLKFTYFSSKARQSSSQNIRGNFPTRPVDSSQTLCGSSSEEFFKVTRRNT